MPELPEVQSVVNYLRPIIINQTIASVIHLNDYTKVFETHSTEQLNKQLAGQKITNVWRRGKYIIIDVAYGHLCIHLRMTGQLQKGLGKEDNPKHYTALMTLVNGCEVYFKDYRKFGRIYFFEDLKILENKLGCEPLSLSFTYQYLKEGLQISTGIIKPKLLDQKFIAGLGNIYVDEVLWKSRIHPKKKCNQISAIKTKRLHRSIPEILEKSINYNGTTIINFSPGNKTKGRFSKHLKVFGKQGSSCYQCESTIKKIFVSQRGTHYCPKCQRL